MKVKKIKEESDRVKSKQFKMQMRSIFETMREIVPKMAFQREFIGPYQDL